MQSSLHSDHHILLFFCFSYIIFFPGSLISLTSPGVDTELTDQEQDKSNRDKWGAVVRVCVENSIHCQAGQGSAWSGAQRCLGRRGASRGEVPRRTERQVVVEALGTSHCLGLGGFSCPLTHCPMLPAAPTTPRSWEGGADGGAGSLTVFLCYLVCSWELRDAA